MNILSMMKLVIVTNETKYIEATSSPVSEVQSYIIRFHSSPVETRKRATIAWLKLWKFV